MSKEESYIRFRISKEKKEEFKKAVEKNDPNLNMSIVLLNYIDDYIKKTSKKKGEK